MIGKKTENVEPSLCIFFYIRDWRRTPHHRNKWQGVYQLSCCHANAMKLQIKQQSNQGRVVADSLPDERRADKRLVNEDLTSILNELK